MWLVGCHGGAGVTTLAATGLGRDSQRALPTVVAAPTAVLLVTRLSATGMRAASAAAEAWQGGQFPAGLVLLGLIVVAAGPGRPPRLAKQRLDLVAGWCPQVWQVKWLPELLGTDPADVAGNTALRAAIPASLVDVLTPGRTPTP